MLRVNARSAALAFLLAGDAPPVGVQTGPVPIVGFREIGASLPAAADGTGPQSAAFRRFN